MITTPTKVAKIQYGIMVLLHHIYNTKVTEIQPATVTLLRHNHTYQSG